MQNIMRQRKDYAVQLSYLFARTCTALQCRVCNDTHVTCVCVCVGGGGGGVYVIQLCLYHALGGGEDELFCHV